MILQKICITFCHPSPNAAIAGGQSQNDVLVKWYHVTLVIESHHSALFGEKYSQ